MSSSLLSVTRRKSILSFTISVKGSNLDDNEFMFKWAITGRSEFFAFRSFKGVGGVQPKKIKFFHFNIFSYSDYGEAGTFYGIQKFFSSAKI